MAIDHTAPAGCQRATRRATRPVGIALAFAVLSAGFAAPAFAADESLAVVTGIEVVGEIGAATVSWTAPAEGDVPVDYEVVADASSATGCTTSELSCRVTGLPADGTDVEFRVRPRFADTTGAWTTITAEGTSVGLAFNKLDGTYNRTVGIGGRVTVDGAPVPTVTVRLEQRAVGVTTWSTLSTRTTSVTGYYAHSLTAKKMLDIRAVVGGGAGRLGAVTAKQRMLVRALISINAANTALEVADQIVLRGSVYPPRPSAKVVVQQRLSGTWRSKQQLTLTSTSRYRFARVLMTSGTAPWRVVYPGSKVFAEGSSPAVTVSVAARPNVSVTTVNRYQVRYSWRAGCPVHFTNLRAISINHRGFDGTFKRGTIIVEKRYVNAVSRAFSNAFYAKFPIRSMIPIDAFYAGGKRTGIQADVASMSADNTSAFNCRGVVGHPNRRSAHSFGNAVDINPRENPYVAGGKVYPVGSSTYLNRSNVRPGMLYSSSAVIKTLRGHGWIWLNTIRDFHHISRYGG